MPAAGPAGAVTSPLRVWVGPGGPPGPSAADWIPGPPARVVRLRSLAEAAGGDEAGAAASVLLLDAALAREPGAGARLAALPAHHVVLAWGERAASVAEDAGRLFLSLATNTSALRAGRALRAAAEHSAALLAASRCASRLAVLDRDLEELSQIAIALASERDLDRLLHRIVSEARRLTRSDAGSLYLVERDGEARTRLHFRVAQNDSLPEVPAPDFTLPFDARSIAGAAATLGRSLRIEDAYALPPDAPYGFDRSFDEQYGYRARSILALPMQDHSGRTVGVLQLINRKREEAARIHGEADAFQHVVPYSERDVERVRSLASQAAVAIENGRLLRSIEELFDSFAKAAVIAIDQRDPTTSGHSLRVASLTCDLAQVIDALGQGPHRDVRFTPQQMRELRYAALLHDFGKVSVPEEVLVKAKKLPPLLIERVRARFALIRSFREAVYQRGRADWLLEHGPSGFEIFEKRLEAEHRAELERLDHYEKVIAEANEPRLLPEAQAGQLSQIAGHRYLDDAGRPQPYLTEEELHYLAIPKGSLDAAERERIQAHVTYTWRFLQEIPWTDDLGQLAEIAYGHHEMLNGTGYPRGLAGDQIPVQTRVLTVADIFDALTASDRPYKAAVPVERALDIIGAEAKSGRLDGEIVRVLVESGVYRRILETDWKEL